MKHLVGDNADEQHVVRALQNFVNFKKTGQINYNVLVEICNKLRIIDDRYPLTVDYYNVPVIITPDIRIILNKTTGAICASYRNSISGSYTRYKKPDTILVYKNNILGHDSHFSYRGYPDTVIYKTLDGEFGTKRCITADELPKDNIYFAIGGYGLCDLYDPQRDGLEDFDREDILGVRDNLVIGYKNGLFYMALLHQANMQFVNAFCVDILRLEGAVMLAGGSECAMHGRYEWAQVNCTVPHTYLIQGYNEALEKEKME